VVILQSQPFSVAICVLCWRSQYFSQLFPYLVRKGDSVWTLLFVEQVFCVTMSLGEITRVSVSEISIDI